MGRLLWIVESLLEESGQQVHGIGLYYAMTFPASSAVSQQLGAFEVLDGATRLSFAWHPLQRLATLTIYPPFLQQHLLSPLDSPLHLLDLRKKRSPDGKPEADKQRLEEKLQRERNNAKDTPMGGQR